MKNACNQDWRTNLFFWLIWKLKIRCHWLENVNIFPTCKVSFFPQLHYLRWMRYDVVATVWKHPEIFINICIAYSYGTPFNKAAAEKLFCCWKQPKLAPIGVCPDPLGWSSWPSLWTCIRDKPTGLFYYFSSLNVFWLQYQKLFLIRSLFMSGLLRYIYIYSLLVFCLYCINLANHISWCISYSISFCN